MPTPPDIRTISARQTADRSVILSYAVSTGGRLGSKLKDSIELSLPVSQLSRLKAELTPRREIGPVVAFEAPLGYGPVALGQINDGCFTLPSQKMQTTPLR